MEGGVPYFWVINLNVYEQTNLADEFISKIDNSKLPARNQFITRRVEFVKFVEYINPSFKANHKF